MYAAEQIIGLLRQADVELVKCRNVPEFCKTIGVHEVTYDRWRREYGGLKVDRAKRMKELEAEVARLKRIVASQGIDMAGLDSPRSAAWSSL